MTTNLRALCAELAEALCGYDLEKDDQLLVLRARADLAAEPQGPTDETILMLAAKTIGYERIASDDCDLSIDAVELIAFARTALARWSNHQP